MSRAVKIFNAILALVVLGFSGFMLWMFTQIAQPFLPEHESLYLIAITAFGIGSLVVAFFIYEHDWHL